MSLHGGQLQLQGGKALQLSCCYGLWHGLHLGGIVGKLASGQDQGGNRQGGKAPEHLPEARPFPDWFIGRETDWRPEAGRQGPM